MISVAVLRKNKSTNYTVIDNNVFLNADLSLKAKGLLCQMLSLPDDWEYSLNGLVALSTDGIASVRATLSELENHNYFRRERVYTNGKISGVEYIISEMPMCENLILENLNSENLILENHLQLNTNTNKVLNKSSTKEIYSAVVGYLNEVTGSSYKWQSKKTQALIDARTKEGFTLDDFRAVIYKKTQEWKDDPKMVKFLRPETLFGTKFESYLNQKEVRKGRLDFIDEL